MFTVSSLKPQGAAPLNYLNERTRSQDYYSEKQNVLGHFSGELAKHLGFKGKSIDTDDKNFVDLFECRNPKTGERLTERVSERRAYDFVCSAPKSVSIMYALGGDKRIKDIHSKAVSTALKEMEKYANVRDRSGDNYHTQESYRTGNFIAASFLHESSRALDPGLHTHNVIFNATYDPINKRIKALENKEMYRNIDLFGRVYQNELATALNKIGYKTEIIRDAKGDIKTFEIKGISQELIDTYSKRGNSVKEMAALFEKQHGRKPTRKELDIISLNTRGKKLTEITDKELFEYQKKQISDKQLKDLQSLKKSFNISWGDKTRNKEAIELALNSITERKSVFSLEDLKKTVLKEFCGEINLKKLDLDISNNPNLVALNEGSKYSTKAVIEEEKRIIAHTEKSINQGKAVKLKNPPFSDKRSIELESNGLMDYSESRKCICGIADNRDVITIFRGVAGAGKTTALKELDKTFKESGEKLHYFAPTRKAVKEVQSGNFTDKVETVKRLLDRHESGNLKDIKNSTIIIDEAGFLSTKQGDQLRQIAEQQNCKIILVGDSSQLKGVERGDYLRLLEEHTKVKTFELSQVRRQSDRIIKTYFYDIDKYTLNKFKDRQEFKEYLESKRAENIEILNNIKPGFPGTDIENLISVEYRIGEELKHLEDNESIYSLRDFATTLSQDKFKESLKFLYENKMIKEDSKYIRESVKEYMKLTDNGKNLDSTALISFTNREVDQLNKEARYKLKVNEILAEKDHVKEVFKSKNLEESRLENIRNYKEGEYITFTRKYEGFRKDQAYEIKAVDKARNELELENGKRLNVKDSSEYIDLGKLSEIKVSEGELLRIRSNTDSFINGETVRVKEVEENGKIKLEDNRSLDKNFKNFEYGYAGTIHKSQGGTYDNCILSSKSCSKEGLKVGASRERDNLYIHTPNTEKFCKSILGSKDRELVTDVLKDKKIINIQDIKLGQMAEKGIDKTDYFQHSMMLENLKNISNDKKMKLDRGIRQHKGISLDFGGYTSPNDYGPEALKDFIEKMELDKDFREAVDELNISLESNREHEKYLKDIEKDRKQIKLEAEKVLKHHKTIKRSIEPKIDRGMDIGF